MEKVTKRFEEDIANHELEVIIEDGVNRILRFKDKSGSSIYHFYVMQTHGKLCFSGDMGDFVFKNHNADMLAWFHGNMSLGYIKEKCHAGATKKYSEEAAKQSIECQVENFCDCYLDDYVEGQHLNEDEDDYDLEVVRASWIENIYQEAISYVDFENEYTLHNSAGDVSIKITDELSFEVDTSEGLSCYESTYHFLWCVLAMNKVAELYFSNKESACE